MIIGYDDRTDIARWNTGPAEIEHALNEFSGRLESARLDLKKLRFEFYPREQKQIPTLILSGRDRNTGEMRNCRLSMTKAAWDRFLRLYGINRRYSRKLQSTSIGQSYLASLMNDSLTGSTGISANDQVALLARFSDEDYVLRSLILDESHLPPTELELAEWLVEALEAPPGMAGTLTLVAARFSDYESAFRVAGKTDDFNFYIDLTRSLIFHRAACVPHVIAPCGAVLRPPLQGEYRQPFYRPEGITVAFDKAVEAAAIIHNEIWVPEAGTDEEILQRCVRLCKTHGVWGSVRTSYLHALATAALGEEGELTWEKAAYLATATGEALDDPHTANRLERISWDIMTDRQAYDITDHDRQTAANALRIDVADFKGEPKTLEEEAVEDPVE